MKFKVYINTILFYLGIRDILPRDIINEIKEIENNEILIDISQNSKFFFSELLKRPVYLRQEVYERLSKALLLLPGGIFLKIYDGYRTLEEQKKNWNREFEKIKDERLTRLRTANPYEDGYGGHQTGGAIDISLCDKNGNDLEMGTKVGEYNEKTKTKNCYLSLEEKRNRKILIDVLLLVGFKNYPVEWWHFCYGDRMWAAYSKKKTCFYGFVNNPKTR